MTAFDRLKRSGPTGVVQNSDTPTEAVSAVAERVAAIAATFVYTDDDEEHFVAELIANLTAYTMRYSGAFTYSATNAAKIATGQPYFQATIGYTACSQSLTTHSLRRVTVDGKLETIQRVPLRL